MDATRESGGIMTRISSLWITKGSFVPVLLRYFIHQLCTYTLYNNNESSINDASCTYAAVFAALPLEHQEGMAAEDEP
jgi:hypothetical protein